MADVFSGMSGGGGIQRFTCFHTDNPTFLNVKVLDLRSTFQQCSDRINNSVYERAP